MATLSGLNVSAIMRATPSKTIVTGRQSGNGPAINFTLQWTPDNDADADGVNTAFADDNLSLAYGATEDWDLYNGLTDAFGDTITNARIRAFMVVNTGLYASLRVGAAASNPWYPWISGASDYVIVPPATASNPGVLLMTAPNATGWTVGNGSADTLRVAHHSDSSEDATYQIAIFGAAT